MIGVHDLNGKGSSIVYAGGAAIHYGCSLAYNLFY